MRSPARRAHQDGFSLTEVLTSVAILAILGLTAVPVFSTLQQEYNLRGAVLRVYGELQKARLAAVTRNVRYRAQVSRDALVYLQEYDIDTGEWKDLTDATLPNDTSGIYVTGSTNVAFCPDGTAGAPAYFTLLNSVGMQKRIMISRTGSIEIP